MGATDLQLGHPLREPRLSLQLIPAEDPAIDSPQHGEDVRQLQRSLEEQGVRCNTSEQQLNRSLWSRCSRGPEPDPATLIVELADAFGPALGEILDAWLRARPGRKVRLKVPRFKIEAEVQTVEEIKDFIARAQELQHSALAQATHEA